MKICHIAPFAPNRCGLYEAARDMARADVLGGNIVYFVDAGVTVGGVREDPKIGAIDDRAGFRLATADPAMINDSDIIVLHTGAPDIWLVKCQAPIIWVVHGRPLACFRPESQGKGNSYSLYKDVATWKRTKKMLYFWEEFKPHWDAVFGNKGVALDYPVIDEARFSPEGEKIKLQNEGKFNVLICDSSREDIDLYETVVSCVETANEITGIKFHFFGFEHPIQPCWNPLLEKLKKLGCLGDIYGRMGDMEKIYRSMDCLISPNRIITRTIGEAISCGVNVIAQNPCKIADYTIDFAQPEQLKEALKKLMNNKPDTTERAKLLSSKKYYEKINKIYKEVQDA